MPSTSQLLEMLRAGQLDAQLTLLYGAQAVASQRERYAETVEAFAERFGERENVHIFSAPGRTELGGNHTDHNHGCVLAASVDADVIGVAAAQEEPVLCIASKGYPLDTVELCHLSPSEQEKNHSASLIRGTAARFEQLGYKVGGIVACTTSNVLKGSGMSSSAAFEVLIGTMLSHLYNKAAVSPVVIAQIAQYAENVYFGKPSGLMDQMASSVGSVISIDFADPAQPIIQKVEADFTAAGYALCIVDTGGNHADLTDEYAAVTNEMRAVSNALGVSYLRETTEEALRAALPQLRESCGDRAVLRALHFFRDNKRVAAQVAALQAGDFDRFFAEVIASGRSSYDCLQNAYAICAPDSQGVPLALTLAEEMLDGCGAWRVHGGFGGTTQNFVPLDKVAAFTEHIEAVFGKGSCHVLSVRPVGGTKIV